MTRYHLSNGEPKRCVATPGNCRLGGFHFDSLEKAQTQAEKVSETEECLRHEVESGKLEAAYRARREAENKLTQAVRNLSSNYDEYRFALLKATTREPNANLDEPDEGVAALPEKQRVKLEELRELYVSAVNERDAARVGVDEARTALYDEYEKALDQLPEDYVVDMTGNHTAYYKAEKELDDALRMRGIHKRHLRSLKTLTDEESKRKQEHYRGVLNDDDAEVSRRLEQYHLLKLQQLAYMRAVKDGRAEKY